MHLCRSVHSITGLIYSGHPAEQLVILKARDDVREGFLGVERDYFVLKRTMSVSILNLEASIAVI